jgi:ADP-ribosylglycohydrolase
MNGGGLGGWEPGEWTDDTQMAICIAEETATGTVDLSRVAGRFLEWFRSGPVDVGVQTGSVLSHSADAAGVAVSATNYFGSHPDRSAGNGSLMRTAPLALASLGDDKRLVELAMSVSALTHADPVAGEACALWCIAIDRAIREGRLDGARDGIDLLPVERRGYWKKRLEEVEAGPPSRFSHNTFVVSAFQAALAAVLHTAVPEVEPCRHLEDALHAAVRIGDDTDTVAAIAGSLLGARWGASAVPVLWRAVLHGKPGVYGRPDYSNQDLVRLAVMSARRGEPDSIGWPDADDLTPYYLENWPAPSRVVALKEDPGVLLGTVFGAATASANVTVSLCRMGRKQLDPVRHPIRIELGLVDGDETANANLDFTFHDLARAMVRWRSENKTVLVHCVGAQHRTPAVGAAYLAEKQGLSGREALRRVCAQLPTAGVNTAFEDALERVWPGEASR